MNKLISAALLGVTLFIACSCTPVKQFVGNPCISNSSTVMQRIVDSSVCALNHMRTKDSLSHIDHLLEDARAVFIFPDVYKAAFMVGAEAGPGVLCAKDDTGFWNGPAFFNMAGIDIGLQGGVEGKSLLVFLMDDQALEDALGGKIDLSLGADLAVGHTAERSSRGTFDAEGNILLLVDQAGAYGGMTYRTGAFMVSNDFNKRYYGKKVSVRELLMTHKHDKPEADKLLLSLAGIY
ncbi:lipid-binding SYLF domain-containing protein [Desulfovibrio sp. JC022]|uniref:lipid-binding SYLF domain-containing protein n=1 Tax=Desulfovibrio sp. JC022 TaxID=2593642 RepID=UPI0013D52276|nr:lipid-binding SYLF domain-containing protein [Desulfovibrio sp. JC022]NDV22477.1 lipid-binding SYLF domain-containing protein [Desulfovibrio sp. JC022]